MTQIVICLASQLLADRLSEFVERADRSAFVPSSNTQYRQWSMYPPKSYNALVSTIKPAWYLFDVPVSHNALLSYTTPYTWSLARE